MASANGIVLFGDVGLWGGAAGAGFTNVTVDASNDGWALVFQTLSADPITHLGFRYGSRTGTPPTYSIRLEGVDGSGLPDNADAGGGSPTAATFTPPASAAWDGTWQWVQLTNAYTPARGQVLAATIRYSSGTADASNFGTFGRLYGPHNSIQGFPYGVELAGGTWTKRLSPLGGWRTASGRYGYIAQASYSTATANTAGHRSACHFTLPAAWGSTYQVLGALLFGKPAAAGGSCVFGLWDSSWNALQAVTLYGDQVQTAASQNTPYRFAFDEATLATLSYGTKYYLGLEVVSGTVSVSGIELAEAADRSAFPNGLNRGLVTYNGVTTTETDTVLPQLALILDDTTVPSGGGGAVIGPGLVY